MKHLSGGIELSKSPVVDSVSAIGIELDTSNALSTTGAKLLSLKKNGVEKVYFDKDGLLNLMGGYYQAGVADAASYYSAGTLTIPLDGRVYRHVLAANTTLAFSGTPTPPRCSSVEIILVQAASGGPYTLAYPAGAHWPYGIIQAMPIAASARLKLSVQSDPSGVIDISAAWYGVGA